MVYFQMVFVSEIKSRQTIFLISTSVFEIWNTLVSRSNISPQEDL